MKILASCFLLFNITICQSAEVCYDPSIVNGCQMHCMGSQGGGHCSAENCHGLPWCDEAEVKLNICDDGSQDYFTSAAHAPIRQQPANRAGMKRCKNAPDAELAKSTNVK